MKVVKVNLGKRSYEILIGKGAISKLSTLRKTQGLGRPFFVITNKKINALHGKRLAAVLRKLSTKILFYEVPDSEKAKSFSVYIKAIRRLASFAVKEKPIIFAFGGGVVGDLAGFVASAYRRGVPYVQIPTTLLAQVDSAVGGKVAIDIEEAKNIVGNFYQPGMVICDLHFLTTLPVKELRDGLTEIIKYGIIKDAKFFAYLEKNLKSVLKRRPAVLEHIVLKSCSIKARVVEKDELDTLDLRAMLNFGHTIGHAIEAATRYSGVLTHGEAVRAGMVMASIIALRLGMIDGNVCKKINSLIQREMPRLCLKGVSSGKILTALSYDKKFIDGVNRFILPEKIGCVKIVENVPQALIKEVIESYKRGIRL